MVIVPVSAFAAMLYGANRRASHLDGRDGADRTAPENDRRGPI